MGEYVSSFVREPWGDESGVHFVFGADDSWGPPSMNPEQFSLPPGVRDEVQDWDTPTLVLPSRLNRRVDIVNTPLIPEIVRGYTIRAINVEDEIAKYTKFPPGEAKNNTIIGQALEMYDVYTQDPWREPRMTVAKKLLKLSQQHGRIIKKRGRSPVFLVAMDGPKVLGVATALKIPDGKGFSEILNPSHPQNIYSFEMQMRDTQRQYGLNNIIYVSELYVKEHRGGQVAMDLIKALTVYARSVGGHDVLMRTVRAKPDTRSVNTEEVFRRNIRRGSKSQNPRLAMIAQAIDFEEIIYFGEYPFNHDVLYGLWRGVVDDVDSRLIEIEAKGLRAVFLDMMRNERRVIH